MPDNAPKWEETQPLDVPRFEDTQPVDTPSFDQTNDPTVKDEIRAAIPEIVTQIRNAIVAPPQMGAEFTPQQMNLGAGAAPVLPGISTVVNQFQPQRELALREARPTDRPAEPPLEPQIRARTLFDDLGGVIRPEERKDLNLAERTARTVAGTAGQMVTGIGQAAQMSGRGYQEIAKRLGEPGAISFAGKMLEKAGQATAGAGRDLAKKMAYEDPALFEKVVGGFASTATFFVPGLGVSKVAQAMSTTPKIAAAFGIATSSLMESSLEAGLAREEAIQQGATPERADRIAAQVFRANVPITALGNKLGIFAKAKSLPGKFAQAYLAEGGQEALQEVAQNVPAGREAMTGTGEAFAIGGLVGGVLGAGASAAEPSLRAEPPAAPPPAAQPAAIEGVAPVIDAQKLNDLLDRPAPKFEETQPVPDTRRLTQSQLREEELARITESAAQGLKERPTAPVEGWKQEAVPGGGTSLESPSGYRVFVPEGQDPQRAAAAIREIERVRDGGSQIPEAPKPVEPAPVEAPTPVEAPESAPAQKPYWQLTKEEFRQIRYGRDSVKPLTKNMRELHQAEVQGAITRGEAVPPSVLKDYPELAPAPAPQMPPAKAMPGADTPINEPDDRGLRLKEELKRYPRLGAEIADRAGTIMDTAADAGETPISENDAYEQAVYLMQERFEEGGEESDMWRKQFSRSLYKVLDKVDTKPSPPPPGSTPAKTAPAKAPLTPIEEAIKSFDFPADSQVNKNLRLYHVVDLFKNMEGGVPEVVKTFRRKGGVLGTASNQGKIRLRAALGLNENIASLVLAHEISHVADAIYGDTTRTYARGNILGRIGAMDRYVYDNLAATLKTKEEMTAAQPAVKAIREPFLELARKQANAMDLKGPARAQFIRAKIRELSDPNLRAAGFVSQEAVSKELTDLSRWWNSDKNMKPTGVELYAEGMSVYLLSPKDVAKRAPIFYDLTKNWLQKKPEFEQLVNEFWAKLEQSPEIGQDKILNDLTANFQKNRETKAAAEDKVMAAKKDVAPLDWLAMKLNYTIPLTNKMDRLGLQPWDAPFHEIQMWKHHAPITEKYLRDINDSIREAILGTKNLTEDMVGIQLALNRIALGDRSELLNTLGITEKSAPEIGARLKERAGEDYDKLLEVVERVYDAHNEILKGADGVLNANGLKKLRDNRYYATFSLNKFIEESVGGNGEISKLIHPQVGSLDAIGNPLEALIDKDVRMQYTFLRSKAFQAFYQWGMKINDGTVLEVERVKGGNIKGAPPGYKTLYWLWDSKVKAMHVKDGYYQIFSQDHSEAARHTNVLEAALKFFKYAFVNLNPAFFVTNPIRDSFFTAQNLAELPFFSMDQRYKFGALESLARTIKELPAAVRHQMGKETSAAIQELKGTLGVGQSEYNRDMGELSLGLERMFRSNGVFTRTAKFSSPGQALLRAMEIALDVGRASDMASKVAALKLLKEKHPDADPAWLAHILRTRAGTPDTTNRGAMTGAYNWVWMYSQVAFEGWRGNYASAKENPGSFTAKLFGQSILPRLLVLAAGAGLIGRDDEEKKKLQKVMNGIPEWFKAGSLVIPIGLDANGKSVFITLPQDELSRTAGGVAYFMVKNMTEANRDSLLKDTMESLKMAVDYGQTQAPGLNPLIQLGFQAGALADLPKGEGPKDSFGRPMISARYRAEYQNQKGRALTEYLKNVWNFAGLTTIYKFKPGPEEVQSELESLLRIPIAGAMASRFIRVSSSGASNKPYEAKAEVESERATLSNDRIDAMLKFREEFMDKNSGKEPSRHDTNLLYARLKKEMPEAMRGVSPAELHKSYLNYTVSAGATKALSAFKSGSAEGKAAALNEVYKTNSPKEFNDFVGQARRDRLISPKVMGEFNRKYRRRP